MPLCHIMDYPNACDARRSLSTVLVKQYPYAVLNEDGAVRHYTYDWDDGGRSLLRCKHCGGLLLYQWSEFHCFSDDHVDDFYCDWFPVDSEEEADKLNRKYAPCNYVFT